MTVLIKSMMVFYFQDSKQNESLNAIENNTMEYNNGTTVNDSEVK